MAFSQIHTADKLYTVYAVLIYIVNFFAGSILYNQHSLLLLFNTNRVWYIYVHSGMVCILKSNQHSVFRAAADTDINLYCVKWHQCTETANMSERIIIMKYLKLFYLNYNL